MDGFKDWLLNEDGFGDSGGNSWDLLYPTRAGDYTRISSSPLDHFFLQWKWRRGEELGRVLHNIDNDEFQERGYVSLSSSIPDEKDEFWKHKEDKSNEGSIKPCFHKDLQWIVQGKTSKDVSMTDHPELNKHWSKLGSTGYEADKDLDKIFHDEDRHTHKWPTIDPNYIDADWTLPEHQPKRESVLEEGDFLGSGFHVYPTIAPDWNQAQDSTKKIKLVKDRWQEEEPHLKFHNIDLDSINKIPFKSVNSRNMPDIGDGFWKHKPDNNEEGSVKIEDSPDMDSYGIAPHADELLDVDHGQKTTHPFGNQSTEQPDHRLGKIFGDTPSGKFPEIEEKYADADWTLPKHQSKVEESVGFKQWFEFSGSTAAMANVMHGGIQTTGMSITNDNMPVRSKYSTADGASNFGSKSPPRKDKKGNPSTVDSEWLGKKRSPLSKHPKERKSMWIDRDKRNITTRDDRPDIVY